MCVSMLKADREIWPNDKLQSRRLAEFRLEMTIESKSTDGMDPCLEDNLDDTSCILAIL